MRRTSTRALVAPAILTVMLGTGRVPARAAAAPDWPMFRGNALHTGFSPVNIRLPLTPAWTWKGSATCIVSSPTIVDGTVYIGTRDDPTGAGAVGSLIAIDLATGALKWRYNAADKARTIMTHTAKLNASAGADNPVVGGIDSTPAVSNGTVYVTSTDGALHAVTTTGQLLWRLRTGGSDKASPAVVNGTVYVGSGFRNKDFWAVDAARGTVKWRTNSGLPDPVAQREGQYVYASEAVADGTVYGAANDGGLYSIDAASGKLNWRFETKGGVYMHSPTIAGDLLVAAPGDFDTAVYGVNRRTGQLAWKYTSGLYHSYVSSPAYDGTSVYVGIGEPDQQMVALDAITGKQKWRVPLGYASTVTFTSSPAVANNVLLVGAAQAKQSDPASGRLVALDKATGALLWQTVLPNAVVSSPAVAGNYVVVGCMDGTVRAYSWSP